MHRHVWWWGYSAWKPTFPNLGKPIKDMVDKGFKIVVMSNQFVLSQQFDHKDDFTPAQKLQTWFEKLIDTCDTISKMAGEPIDMQVMASLSQVRR